MKHANFTQKRKASLPDADSGRTAWPEIHAQYLISNANSRLMASESGATYHLIGGSFTHFEQASEYSESAKALGYDPLIMFPEPGKFNSFSVSIYRSTNKSDVVTYNKSITNSGKKGGWIYEQK
ncbi:MAG: hypothetical protein R3B93_12425 [Bacteroidia bacterium]